jgi:hypothetical protein
MSQDLIGILGLVFFALVCVGAFIESRRRKKRYQAGESAFLDGDYNTAYDNYEKLKKDSTGEYAVELIFKQALVKFMQHNNPEDMRPLLAEVLNRKDMFKIGTYDFLNKQATKLKVSLNENVYNVFRDEELKCLKRLLSSTYAIQKEWGINHDKTWDRAVGNFDRIQIKRSHDSLTTSDYTKAEYDRSNGELRTNISLHENKSDGNLRLEVNEVFFPLQSIFVSIALKPTAFYTREMAGLTNKTIARIISEGLPEIVQEVCLSTQANIISVTKQIFNFAKGRQLINEIDQVMIHSQRHLTFYWVEDLDHNGSALQIRCRIHWWQHTLNTDNRYLVDFASIPKDIVPSDKLLQSFVKVDPNPIQLQITEQLDAIV